MYTNTNYKFNNPYFTKNLKYYDIIEKTNEIIKATNARGKTTNYGTNYEKSQSKTRNCKNSQSKKPRCTYYSIRNNIVNEY